MLNNQTLTANGTSVEWRRVLLLDSGIEMSTDMQHEFRFGWKRLSAHGTILPLAQERLIMIAGLGGRRVAPHLYWSVPGRRPLPRESVGAYHLIKGH